MEKENKEVVEKTTNEPKSDVTKVKMKMTQSPEEIGQSITKVDLAKPPTPKEDEVKTDSPNDSGVVASIEDANTSQEQEEVQPEAEAQETSTLEEVTQEEVVEVEEKVVEAIAEAEATGKPLPENIQKLVDFIDETGGDINDYVKLNKNYDELDNEDLLLEFYKQTKPHLDTEEINFLMEDQFSYDEDVDSDRDIRRKKLALKEQVANAKTQLEENKSKYYEDIKAGSKLTSDQQKAMDFFNRYNKESEVTKKTAKTNSDIFTQKTDKVFNDKFKGFEYNVGEKKFRFNVKDTVKLKENQGDINNFIKKFLNKDNTINDAKGYHKGLFTAMNPDQVANHFYEQGKADALKDSIAKSKNVSMDPRQAHQENVNTSGITARVLNPESDFKFKIKNNKFKN